MLRRARIQALIGFAPLFWVLVSGCQSGDGSATVQPRSEVPAVVQADQRRIQAGYVGSEACRSCHAAETAIWERSRHHAIFKPGGRPSYLGVAPQQFDEENLHVVSVMLPAVPGAGPAAPKRPAMNMVGRGAPGTFPVDAVIGGGRMESYVTHLKDGSWLLLPLAYQVEQQAYTGFRQGTCGAEMLRLRSPRVWQSYERVWNHRCIDCHVTAGSIGFQPQTQSYTTTYVDPGAGCEACHGPGAAHVKAARAGRGGEGIIQPEKLATGEQMGVCAACHGLAYPFETRWGGNRPYRPGDRYAEAFLPLLRRRESPPYTSITHADHTPATGVMEYQGLAQSRCYLEGKATCLTCHDPHGGGRGAHALKEEASSSALCAGCHSDIVAAGRTHTHHPSDGPGGSCVDCHMPPTVQALGTRLASHAIDVPLPVNNLEFGVPDACSLCHADQGVKWTSRQYTLLWGSPEKTRRRRLARMFVEKDAAALAQFLADRKESDLLRADAAAALTRIQGPQAAAALVAALGEANPLLVRRHAADLLGSLGPAAETPFEEQVKQFDALKAQGVLAALRQAQAKGPSSLRLGAAAALARLGTDDGLERLEELRQDPVLQAGYRLPQILGKYYLYAQEMDKAAAAYQRVLDITPNNMTAIQDLGFIRFTTGQFQAAHDLWMRGLTLTPDDEELKQNIHLAEDEMRKQKTADSSDAVPGKSHRDGS